MQADKAQRNEGEIIKKKKKYILDFHVRIFFCIVLPFSSRGTDSDRGKEMFGPDGQNGKEDDLMLDP